MSSIILINPEGKIDENKDKIDKGNHNQNLDCNTRLSSSIPGPSSPHKKEKENKDKRLFSETKIVYGTAAIMEVGNEVLANCKDNYDVYCHKYGPEFMIAISPYKEQYARLKINTVKIRLITDITADNLKYCKEIIDKLNADIRHLQGTKGNFAISDKKIYVGTTAPERDKPVSDLVYSNAKGIIEQNQFVFDSLWEKSIPAEQRIREIEEGMLPVETRIVDNPGEIYSLVLSIIGNSNNGLSNCSTIGGFQMIYEDKKLFDAYASILSRYKAGKAKRGVRWVTHIENNNEQIDLINYFLNIGIEIRHTNNLPPISFALSDKQFQATIEKMEHGKTFTNILYSTEPLYIKHFHLFFEEIWRSGIDAKQRISQIKSGIATEYTKVIENPLEIKNIFLEMLEDSQEEILIIFPSLNSVKRQAEIGLFNLFKLKNQQNFRIRILCPNVVVLKEILLLEYSKEEDNKIANIAIREIVKQQSISSIILMTDRKNLITIEVKDNTKEKFEDATGFATYSTSTPTVYSYLSIFETLWAQTEISDSLRIANEKLVESEEMEREFINTAAHELRTPTQAIMGYAELDTEVFSSLLKNPKVMSDNELNRTIIHLKKHFDIIFRNSVRLDDLISKLLDVSRIESNLYNSLSLHKEKLDLVSEIKESINIELNQKIGDKNIDINLISDSIKGQVWVNADKSRLHQIVINIVGNAIKFSNQNDKIDIRITESNLGQVDEDADKKDILVEISDNGKGISPQILPKLFEKFVSDSDIGTGLGLYISKNLVEAHGGRIWAFNNKDKPGSTFIFSLPKLISSNVDDNLTK